MTKFSMFKRIGLTLGCAALYLNAPLRAGEQVPAKGTFNPIVFSTTQVDPTHLRFDAHVIVLATQLGRARGPAVFILDLATFVHVGEFTWVAANGDAVSGTFVGQFIPTDTLGLFDNVEAFEIVDGTGRFEGATGSGIAGGQFNGLSRSQRQRRFRSRQRFPLPVPSSTRALPR
jgi:hypothetical protein